MLLFLLRFAISAVNEPPYVLPQGLIEGVTAENQQWIISMVELKCPSHTPAVTLRSFYTTMLLKSCLDVGDKNAIIQEFKTYEEIARQQVGCTSEPLTSTLSSAEQEGLQAMAALLQGNLDAIPPNVWRDYAQYILSGMTSPMPASFVKMLINDVLSPMLPPPFNMMKIPEDIFDSMMQTLHSIPAELPIGKKILREEEIMKDAFTRWCQTL